MLFEICELEFWEVVLYADDIYPNIIVICKIMYRFLHSVFYIARVPNVDSHIM